jgi:site-specific DNA-methyltransferase (adenine-specific)
MNAATTSKERYAYEHHALMGEQIAGDLIRSWSRPGSLVLDPMCGAGTTLKAALLLDRFYLGFEIYAPYCEIAERRLRDAERLHRGRLAAAFRPPAG